MAATYNQHIYQHGQRLSQSQAQQQQPQHRRYPSGPALGVGLGGHTTRHQHAQNLRAQAASPAMSTSSYEHIVFSVGGESDDDVVVYRPHASASRHAHHVRSPSAPTFSTTSSTLAPPFAPGAVPRHAPAPRPAPTFQLRMIPWSDDRSDLESEAGSTDEIVFPSWGISLPRPPFREDDTFSEATTEDNVLFSRPRSRANWADDVNAAMNGTGVDGIESALANLNMGGDSASRVQSPTPPPSPGRKKKRHHHHHRRAKSDGVNSNSQAGSSKQSPATPKAKPGKLKPVVPEEDEVPDMPSSEALSAAYEEAARYITYFLSNPAKQHSKSAQLAFLQSLIIELGLYQPPITSLPTPPSSPPSSSPTTPSPPAAASPPTESGSPPPLATMPSTLTSARAALKSRAFVSIREYLHARTNGRDAIAATVHPSRSSLRRALQDKGERIVRGQAKQAGLGVLLVTCHHYH